MTIDLKTLIKQHVSVNPDNTSAVVMLEKVHEGDWELARKSEYKRDIYYIPNSEHFLEVCFSRSGSFHSSYTYDKPKFSFVIKKVISVVEYPSIINNEPLAAQLQSEHFDKNDETTLQPLYCSGWVYAGKVHMFESVYDIDGQLLKQTLYGNSDWTELVEYSVVDKVEKQIITYKKS